MQKKIKLSSAKFHCLLNWSNIQSNNMGAMFVILSLGQIPVPFLIMLVTQFILIVIDRALYLRKNILGKFIFQILLVILIHVWLFFVLPYVTKRSATSFPSLSLSLSVRSPLIPYTNIYYLAAFLFIYSQHLHEYCFFQHLSF